MMGGIMGDYNIQGLLRRWSISYMKDKHVCHLLGLGRQFPHWVVDPCLAQLPCDVQGREGHPCFKEFFLVWMLGGKTRYLLVEHLERVE